MFTGVARRLPRVRRSLVIEIPDRYSTQFRLLQRVKEKFHTEALFEGKSVEKPPSVLSEQDTVEYGK